MTRCCCERRIDSCVKGIMRCKMGEKAACFRCRCNGGLAACCIAYGVRRGDDGYVRYFKDCTV